MSKRRALVGVAILASIVVVMVIAVAYPRTDPAFTRDANGRTVDARVGDVLTVKLDENPTTGYLWKATATGGLVITTTEYRSDDHSGTLAGAGGVRTWTITVTAAGAQTFTTALQPPDQAAAPVSTFSLNVAAR